MATDATPPIGTGRRLHRAGAFAALIALVAALVVLSGPTAPAGAQADNHSDWMPIVGEWRMGCTAAIGGSGPCAGHHDGWAVDINMDMDAPIYAAGAGTVAWMDGGCAPAGGDGGCNNRAGNYVAVDHGDHLSRYIHLASFADGIEMGAPIAAGQLIGYAGNSGTSGTGLAHLHYDEIAHPISVTQRIFFGPMLACHGDTPVQYPDVLGSSDWQDIPWGTLLRNDGYECLGGVTAAPPPPPPPIESTPGGSVGMAFGNFNGDRFDDLAIGVPGEKLKRKADAGLAALVYGTADGPRGRTENIRQGKGARGAVQARDMFGAAIASGDFDCDGRDDLAIGVPGEDRNGQKEAGIVSITHGAPAHAKARPRMIFQGKGNMGGAFEAGDLTGAALAVGDFNDDGCDDLAIGAPGETVGSLSAAGAVHVMYGAPGGFTTTTPGSGSLYQDGGLAGFTEARDMVGAALASGDFNCDGIDDLAIGAPGESIDGFARAGAVSIVHGSERGIGADPVTLYQGEGIAGILEAGDQVGMTLAAGDFNGDGCGDLATGAPTENLTGGRNAGVVSVSFGSSAGFVATSVHFQTDGGLAGTIDDNDNVAAALAAVDLDCDGIDDLAVGAPGEDIDGIADTGWVGVLRGSPDGMEDTPIGFSQSGGGIRGSNDEGDHLGASLAAGDVNGDGCGDLAIGVPGEDILGRVDAGRVVVVLGSSGTLTSRDSLTQRGRLPGKSEPGDLLGGPGVSALLGLSLQ